MKYLLKFFGTFFAGWLGGLFIVCVVTFLTILGIIFHTWIVIIPIIGIIVGVIWFVYGAIDNLKTTILDHLHN
jgi:hypothetical protein